MKERSYIERTRHGLDLIIESTPRHRPSVIKEVRIRASLTPAGVQLIRRRLGMTQAELAAALHVTVTTVARWEQGARAVTPLAARSLSLLAKLHGVAQRRRARKAS